MLAGSAETQLSEKLDELRRSVMRARARSDARYLDAVVARAIEAGRRGGRHKP